MQQSIKFKGKTYQVDKVDNTEDILTGKLTQKFWFTDDLSRALCFENVEKMGYGAVYTNAGDEVGIAKFV